MDELGLKLTAQVDAWIGSLDKAAKAAERLVAVVREVERGVQGAVAGIEAAGKKAGAATGSAFAAAATQFDRSATSIEQDAARASKSLDGLGKSAQRSAQSVEGAAKGIGRSTADIGRSAADATRNLSAGFSGVETTFKAVSDRVSGAVLNIRNAVLGLGALRFGQAAVGSASEFEAALGQLAIVSADTGKPIAALKQELLDLSRQTPLALGDLTKAYATAVGSLPKGANQAQQAFEALDAAQKAARASGATTEETLRGVTALLNTYGDTGLTAAQITDKLFATFDQGAATVPDLTASIGQVAGIAKGFGIGIDEVFGSIAVLTRGGQTASEAITNLRQALISTANGGAMGKVAGQLKDLGLEADLFSAESLRQNGLIGVLEQVEKAGGKPVLNKLYTDTQGLLAVQTLLSKGLAQTRDDIDRIGDSAGKTDAAVATISGNFDQLAGVAKNKLGVAMIEIGERIMPTVARVLGQLADYAERNGAQIAEGIGKAVEALAKFGEWVVEWGPTVLKFLVAVKGVSFFAGLTKDIIAATGALKTFSDGFAASQALATGLGALGGGGAATPVYKTRFEFDAAGSSKEVRELVGFAEAGGEKAGTAAGAAMDRGLAGKLKGLGGTLKAAFSSPGVLAAAAGAFTLGYDLGTRMMEALGDAIEAGTQRQIVAAIDELDRQLQGRLKDLGARTVDEASAIRKRIVSGEAVQTAPGKVQTLREVSSEGGPNAVQAAFNAGLAALAADVQKAQAATANGVKLMADAAAKIEGLKRSRGTEAEIAAAEAEFAQYQAVVQSNAAHVGALLDGSKKLVAGYTQVTAAAAQVGEATANTARTGAGAAKGAADAAKATADTFLDDIVKEYEATQANLAALQLEGRRLAAEAAQNAADALKAIYDQETEAKVAALQAADVKESQLVDLRIAREQGLTSILDAQIAAMRQVADVRIEEAQAAAAKEVEAAKGSADAQALIAANLALREETIQADLAARVGEIRAAALERQAEEERQASKARFEEAQRLQEQAAAVNRRGTAGARVQSFVETLADVPAASLREGERQRRAGPSEAGGSAIGEIVNSLALVLGPIGAIIQAGMKLPEILNEIAGMLTTGLDDFVHALFDSILNVLMALVDGLPEQIDRLLTQTIPAFIEALVGALPEIVGKLIILLPRIAWSVAKAIAYALPIALYDGVVKAGEAMIEFFTSGTVKALGEGIEDAFSAVTEGIKAAFLWIADKLRSLLPGGSTDELIGSGIGAGIGGVAGFLATGGNPVGAGVGAAIGGYIGNKISSFFHEGGTVNAPSNSPLAAAMASVGAPRFAGGGMVGGVDSLARRRLSQILSGDDVPALLAPGEGVLTQRGVQAVGGPGGVDAINRGNSPAATPAQVVLSASVGGDRALAALISRIVSVSISSPSGSVRGALNRSQRATVIPGWSPLRPA